MNDSADRPRVRISSMASFLAAIPHLLGYTPHDSFVVVGTSHADVIHSVFRYDLPDPPDTTAAVDIATHAATMLALQRLPIAVAAGYGPGRLVTPIADALRTTTARIGLQLRDVLRVEDSRYWSYICTNPQCCPAEGVPFDNASDPVGRALAAIGLPALARRETLAATIAPVTGTDAEAMQQATRQAERVGRRLMASGPQALERAGLAAVRSAIGVYRDGGSLTPAIAFAWLAFALARMRIRDDAWARMNPAHRSAHRRLWTDLVRRTQPGYIAAPASLLAFTAWQSGDGTLANIALDRALADTPNYSMALLLGSAINSGTPPSKAVLPMTPDQVAASYADDDTTPAGPDSAANEAG